MTNIPLRCRCGTMRGVASDVSPTNGSRLVCYCDDCQAFAHFLGRDDVLDRHGGTDIFHMTPAQLTISEGAAELRCMRLSEKGMLRWYAGCCRTPIANTMAVPRLPFVGVISAFMDHAADGRTRDAVLGPPLAFTQTKFAVGGTPPQGHPGTPLGFLARSVWHLGRAWLAGRYSPTPLFDLKTGKPLVTPQVLTLEERRELKR